MKNTLVLCFLLSIGMMLHAQDGSFTSIADSDPASKNILDGLQKDYAAYQSMEADFTLTIEIPEEDKEVQKGIIIQKGEKYRLDINGQCIVSDGTTLWYHVASNNEVQISDADEGDDEEDLLSPKNFMKFYKEGKFIVSPVMAAKENGQTVRWIELKPTDEDSEYSKLRMSLHASKNELQQIKAFAKDGSRFTLKINELVPNKKYTDNQFTFDVKKYPQIRIEDTRI